MDKDLLVIVGGIVLFFTILLLTSVVGSYIINEQILECMRIAPSEITAIACQL